MIPNACGKLDPDGKPYRYYTCGYAHKERSDAKCPVRHVSASALETAVVGFLGECSQHQDILSATMAKSRERNQGERAPIRARLTAIEAKLASITDQLRNCAKALVLGQLAAEEGLSPGSITHHIKLLLLADEIQDKLLDLTTADQVRRFGLNQMKALADLPLDEQRRRFARLAGQRAG
jgi:hypothetical protein